MTGDEIRKEKQRIKDQIEDLEHEMRKEFELDLQQAVKPYYDLIRKLVAKCPHKFHVAWINGHNGDEEEECEFCNTST